MYKIVKKTSILNDLFKKIRISYSTQPAIKVNEDYRNQLKEFEQIARVTPKFRTKQPQKPPFVKNLLLGKFDTDILAYPELKKDDLKELNEILEPVKAVLQQPELKDCTELNRNFLQKLSENELIGLQVPQLIGGRELSATETCRFFEYISHLKLHNSIINTETLPVQTLFKFGNDTHKSRYLTKLINGEAIAAFCLVQSPSTTRDPFDKVTATTEDGKIWVLNGSNKSVINGSSADFFVVIAQTDVESSNRGIQPKMSVFVIDRDSGGIVSKKMGGNYLNNVEVSSVTFENVHIPAENILGDLNGGEEIISAIYPLYRLSTGPVCSTISKSLINNAIKHFLKISHEPFPLYETDAICSKIGEFTTSLYAVESVIYLTTGLMDTYENQDVELETAIVKVFASEQALKNTVSCMDLIGIESLMEDHWCNQLHAEAAKNVVLNESNDNLKMIIALFGLQFAGKEMNEMIKKLRNPFFHAPFVFKKMWKNQRHIKDNPKLNLKLHYNLHQSLMQSSEELEYCVLRLQFACETLLFRYGQEVVNQHIELRRLADCMIDIYAMTACISRASRSYCIGLQHAEMEVYLAMAFCLNAHDRVKKRIIDIYDGEYFTNDKSLKKFAKNCFKFKEYFPVHALSRNY